VRSRQYYESLSVQQLIDAARFESREGRPQPELLAVLADTLDEMDVEVCNLTREVEELNDRIADLTTDFYQKET
jgi:hypothetical protein